MNSLYYGDNLDVMRRYIQNESIDLVYLDPPFNSNADYNVLFAEHSGDRAAAQIKAFEDTWSWDSDSARAYEEVVEGGGALSETLQAFRQMLGGSDMLAYLAMMAPRLLELHRVLKPTGSLYLHCDPTASHYLKLVLDAIFGPRNFRNEIIWKRSLPHGNVSVSFGAIHDTILFYVKGGARATWNQPVKPYDEPDEQTRKQYHNWDPVRQDYWQPTSLLNPNPNRPNLTYEFHGHTKVWRWTKERMLAEESAGNLYIPKDDGIPRFKRYLSEQRGRLIQDVWDDIPIASATERLGFPTQKPMALLERIIEASSNEGDTVLDPFCGCGTTISAAQALNRQWIGIDITHLAIGLIKHRLQEQFGAAISQTYRVIGEPVSVPDAERLAKDDPFQFQAWALGLVGARKEVSKGADRGIDGVIYFYDDSSGKAKKIIISVKAGANISVSMVRDLVGTVTREKADLGVLVTFTKPTKPMEQEAADAGFYDSPMGGRHPKIQVLTVSDLLAGKAIDYPSRSQRADVTFKKARRIVSRVQTLPLSALVSPPDDDVQTRQ